MPTLPPDYLYPEEEQPPLTEKRPDVPDNRPLVVLGLVLLFGMASMLVAIVSSMSPQ